MKKLLFVLLFVSIVSIARAEKVVTQTINKINITSIVIDRQTSEDGGYYVNLCVVYEILGTQGIMIDRGSKEKVLISQKDKITDREMRVAIGQELLPFIKSIKQQVANYTEND
ncbi:hypothetical protein M0R04_11945 [Candidatus Dojkabacteria bacterium]|jgi:hypothetical protein|nr:hypothetical protein [Candidatus Dojkabacteria bacterium]